MNLFCQKLSTNFPLSTNYDIRIHENYFPPSQFTTTTNNNNNNNKRLIGELTATEWLVFANKVVCDEMGQAGNTILPQPWNTVLSDEWQADDSVIALDDVIVAPPDSLQHCWLWKTDQQ